MSQEQLSLGLAEQPTERRELSAFHSKGGTPTLEEGLRQNKRNLAQQGRVLAFLREHPGIRFTPPEIAKAVGIARENSVQRSLSDLHGLYLVEKHARPEDKRPGSWGVEVCTWSAA